MKWLEDSRVGLSIVILFIVGVALLVNQQTKLTTKNLNSLNSTTSISRSSISANDVVVTASGDIACEPGQKSTKSTCQNKATSDLVKAINPTAVLALGDLQYPDGRLDFFQSTEGFAGSWGQFKSITWPVPGNHEYMTADAKGYFDYFGSRAGEAGKGYYSFDLGKWHLIALNSEIDVSPTSAQRQWLKQDLQQHKDSYCTLAFWHKPRFSSGYHDNDPSYSGLWQDLYAGGADLVLNGHSHSYERFEAQTPDGKLDGVRGIVEIVAGMGGASSQPLTGRKAHSAAIQNTNFGVLKLALHPKSYSFSFESIPGSQDFADSGDLACHS